MIVSWNWLQEYVELGMSVAELTDRLTLTGLNLEGVAHVGDDVAIDLEVTSNRPDCLGHLGVAREIAVLWQQPLREPTATPATAGPAVTELAGVEVQCPALCPHYTARVLRGIKVGPSPAWLADRLRTLGIAVINNVVDISNYVMLECGQPLHAFDYQKLAGHKIVVRQSRDGEKFLAINHQEYELPAGTCVIADTEQAVALGGVMGGAHTEVSPDTTDVLMEAASFAPLAVRNTARQLQLHSDSSYRFERGMDPERIEWASRRCCALILELAGGKLAPGVIRCASPTVPRPTVRLRLSQLPRILGIEVPPQRVHKILTDLGCRGDLSSAAQPDAPCLHLIPPSWRADLTREIDLIEEVARIHGYEQIPEDASVKMVASQPSREDRVVEQVQAVLVAAGFDEAMTLSAVEQDWVQKFQPWTQAPPLTVSTPLLRRANCLRQTLVLSLLEARRNNEKLLNRTIELFEIASIYLPASGSEQEGKGSQHNASEAGLPDQRRMLTLSSGRSFADVKGVLETLVRTLAPAATWTAVAWEDRFLAAGRACQFKLGERVWGVLGEVSPWGLDSLGLRGAATVAELDLAALTALAVDVRQAQVMSVFPPMRRDLNIVVDQQVSWVEVERVVRQAGDSLLESIQFQDDAYRDADQLGAGKKSLLFSLQLRSQTSTLTNEQADACRDSMVAALEREVGGQLRS